MKRRHTRQELRELFGVVEDSHEHARCRAEVPRPPRQVAQELFAIWSAARAEANLAYDEWCAAPGGDSYRVYRAAEDRADAAQAALARSRVAA